MLDVGKLRHRLTILMPVAEQDSDTGEMESTWYILSKLWGSFEPYSTKDVLLAGTLDEQTEARAVIRYHSGITSKMRVLFRNKIYQITGNPLPDTDSGLEYMTLMLHQLDSGDFEYVELEDGSILRTQILFEGPTTLTTNGILTSFTFDNVFLSGSLSVYINGVHATPGDEYERKLDKTGIDFAVAPASDDVVEVMYAYAV